MSSLVVEYLLYVIVLYLIVNVLNNWSFVSFNGPLSLRSYLTLWEWDMQAQWMVTQTSGGFLLHITRPCVIIVRSWVWSLEHRWPLFVLFFWGKIHENANHLKCLLHVGIERKLLSEPGNTHKLINMLVFKCSAAPGCIFLVSVRSLKCQRRCEGSLSNADRESGRQHKHTQHINTKQIAP